MSKLPARMKALLLKEDGFSTDMRNLANLTDVDPFVKLGEIDVPKPGPGQVLIRVKMAAVNPSDTIYIRGFYGQPRKIGQPAGFEGVGHVVSGQGFMARYLRGKRVAFAASPMGSGSWAQYAVTEAAACIALRKDVRDEDGAALIVNPLTAAAMVDMVPAAGAFIVTAAASQLGKLMAAMAVQTGRRMIAVARRDAPLQVLKKQGAVAVLNEKSKSFKSDLAEVITREKPRVLLDAVGGAVTARIFHAMPNGAKLINYGKLTDEPFTIAETGQFIFMGKTIEGFWLVNWMRKTPLLRKLAAIRAVQARFASGVWKTDVTAQIPLDRVTQDMSGALEQPDGKVMITVS